MMRWRLALWWWLLVCSATQQHNNYPDASRPNRYIIEWNLTILSPPHVWQLLDLSHAHNGVQRRMAHVWQLSAKPIYRI